ncbi:hypothetical protein HanHA300_Chr02g0060031 [Helianthus annuus]|nr:hypothetical protein HanHA300_Chr02g0060031 [Helianthus annuus]KAJ0777675.1 hypothetical protein HanLR1_Chr02g0063171 [Helianthus annuus]
MEIDGLSGFTTKYLGGLRLLLVFESASEAEVFVKLKKDQWSTWLSSVCQWEGQHLSFQRIAWVLIRGVPLQFWGPDIFNQIGNMVGKVIIPSNASDEDTDISVNMIGILTDKVSRINCKLTLQWDGEPLLIWISESEGQRHEWAEDDRSPEWGKKSPVVVHVDNETSSSETEELHSDMNNLGKPKEPLKKVAINSAGALGSKGGYCNMGTTQQSNSGPPINDNYNDESSHPNINNNNIFNSADPCVIPPPPPDDVPKSILEPNSALGLSNLFYEEDVVVDTPSNRPSNENDNMDAYASDPFNLMDIINEVAQQHKKIDLNNMPCSSQPSGSDVRCDIQAPPTQQKLGQKKKRNNFPSMKMKDTLWMGRTSDSSRVKNKAMCVAGSSSIGSDDVGDGISGDSNHKSTSDEAASTIKVGESVGFRVAEYGESIMNQIREAKETNVPQ